MENYWKTEDRQSSHLSGEHGKIPAYRGRCEVSANTEHIRHHCLFIVMCSALYPNILTWYLSFLLNGGRSLLLACSVSVFGLRTSWPCSSWSGPDFLVLLDLEPPGYQDSAGFLIVQKKSVIHFSFFLIYIFCLCHILSGMFS